MSRWFPTIGLITLTGCGTAGNPVSGYNPGTFSLSLSSSSLAMPAGASGSVTVSVTGSDGFSTAAVVSLSNLPPSVTVSPASANVIAGQSQQFTLTAATYASVSTSSVSVTGIAGSQSQQLALNLQITAYAGNIALSRTRYVRTDAVAPYTVLFDSGNNRFFMSDPGSNQIFVLDASTRKQIGSIAVPGAYGMDETPDHSVLYAATAIGDIYAIDPAKMAVTHRYLASQIGPQGFPASFVQVMANGDLALLTSAGNNIDGYPSFAFWNPSTNSFQTGSQIGKCAAQGRIFSFTVTGDRSLLVLVNANMTGLTASELCTIDPVTEQTNTIPITGSPVVPTPDSKSILVLEYGISAQIDVLDARTLAQTASFQVGDLAAGSFAVISPDSSTVYMASLLGGFVYVYDISTGTQVGWIDDLYTTPVGTEISAVDNTGLLAGANVEGAGFLDAAAMQTDTPGFPFAGGEISPATGPVAGGTSVNMYLATTYNLVAVYFGQNLATSITPSESLLYATTPPASPGPADVVSLLTDGRTINLPEGFTYGPTVLEVTPNASTADGGGTGYIFGYGFGAGPSYQIPEGLQVTVGGQTVPIASFNPQGYSYGTAPTPVQSISFTIPPGTAGTAADVAVTTPSGTATLHGGMQYLPAVQSISISDTAALAQGIYDSGRDVYYFTDAAEIRVFSRTLNQWLTPIQVPGAPSGTTHRLWGISLSPNGNNLAVADASAGMIYLLNPDSPGSVQSFPFNQTYVSGSPDSGLTGVSTNPVAVAVSDSGMIYLAALSTGMEGADTFFKLDTTSGNVKDYYQATGTLFGCALGPTYKVALSSDNSRAFFNDDGIVFSIDTATDKVSWATADAGGCYGDYDLSLSTGQSTFEASSYLYDISLNAESYLVLNDREYSYTSYVYGTQLSADGTLLFQPSTNGIDVYDGRLGTLFTRIALPVALSQNYDALVGDGKDNILIAITGTTGTGIAVVDLSSVAEPAPLPYVSSIVGTNVHGSTNESESTTRLRSTAPDHRVVPKFKVPHITNGISPTKAVFRSKQTGS